MISLFARWFEPATVDRRYANRDYLLLGLILLVGAWLRFWGLGNVGLHGDEETMAMPAMAILETGRPELPSGMLYPRALIQIYMMAGSAWLLGESEWAFRLPSAVVGSLAGLAAFFMGRRFLPPLYNLAFVAAITFMPVMVEISQTARMYVFFVVTEMVFIASVFRWERTRRIGSLLLAFGAWLVTLHFHALAAFAAPLLLFPGLSRGSWSMLLQGAAALGAAAGIWKLYSDWIGGQYPETVGEFMERSAGPPSGLEYLAAGNAWILALALVTTAVLCVGFLRSGGTSGTWQRYVPAALLAGGLVAMALLHYHVGGILFFLGILGWLRQPDLPRQWLLGFLGLAFVYAAVHLLLLNDSGLYPGRKLIGAIVGEPSVWPILRFLELAPAAGVVFGAALAIAALRFSRGRAVPAQFLLFGIGVWAPLLAIGFFAGYVPPRYTLGQLPVFLLCAFAGLHFLLEQRDAGTAASPGRLQGARGLILAAAAVLVASPLQLARVVPPAYGYYPDHKGAAEYIESLGMGPEAILIAEDVLQQTYYLGEVDYWLRESGDSSKFSVPAGDGMLDLYTLTPVIESGEALAAALRQHGGSPVYVIGSGEDFIGAQRNFRGDGIKELLDSPRFQPVYVGRDGRTIVWKALQPGPGRSQGEDAGRRGDE